MNSPGVPQWMRTADASIDGLHGSDTVARVDATPARFCPIGVDRLDEVMVIELQAYPYPWSRGNFIDALAAGYLMQGLESLEGELLAYQIAMAGVDEWHLLNLTVAPAQQRRGLALRLLRALARHTVDTGAQDLWLEVRPSNWRARGLYERFGFRQVGLRRGYYPDAHGRREDALVLRWREPGGLADDLD
jgi:[ribosomal protein S18]-alanine N-acetyltransferase